MKYALNEQGDRIEATPGARARCACCDSEVIAKCGDVNVDHWAHRHGEACDPWVETENDWARRWKNAFPQEWVEQVVVRGGKRHFVDVAHPDGIYLFLRSKTLDKDTVRKREDFFGATNCVWLFDATEGDFDIRPQMKGRRLESPKLKVKFRWKQAKKRVVYPKGYTYVDLGKRAEMGYKVLLIKDMYIMAPNYGTGTLFASQGFAEWFTEGKGRCTKPWNRARRDRRAKNQP